MPHAGKAEPTSSGPVPRRQGASYGNGFRLARAAPSRRQHGSGLAADRLGPALAGGACSLISLDAEAGVEDEVATPRVDGIPLPGGAQGSDLRQRGEEVSLQVLYPGALLSTAPERRPGPARQAG